MQMPIPSLPFLQPPNRVFGASRHLRPFPNTARAFRNMQPTPDIGLKGLPHLTRQSTVHQISVSDKAITFRRAVAIGHVSFSNPEPFRLVREHSLKKGDVLAVARVAAIMAIKKTGDLIPLAHGGVGVEGCVVDVEVVGPRDSDEERSRVPSTDPYHDPRVSTQDSGPSKEVLSKNLSKLIGSYGGIRIAVSVSTTAKTGVEMEALTGVVGAGLTVIDMCKAIDRHLKLEGVEVVGKSGGKSGSWGISTEENDK